MMSEASLDMGFDSPEIEIKKDKDGEAFVRLTSDGVYFKVTSPENNGHKIQEKTAIQKIEDRSIFEYDKNLVAKIVKRAEGKYVKIGEFVYNPANDAIMTVDITDQEMKAIMIARPPGPGGTDLTLDSILTFLKNNSVVHGVKDDILGDFEEHPFYDQPVVVAEGTKPLNGEDAKIIYTFKTDHSQISLKEKNGRVDFKELNLVENVVEGQVLAKKVSAQKGQPGRTVTGKMLPAKSGKDVSIQFGKNVKLTEEGMVAIAETNGQVILTGERISVETINVIQGDVGVKTGNIVFLGTVIVKGSIDDGFNVKASGNIEVMGNVGKCDLDAEGDIIVHQGINGKMGGMVRSGKGVWSKFIQNSNINSGSIVVVSDGIINSQVSANEKIICQGKRASIVGGTLRASQEIMAKTFGSIAGGETILEVGYDPNSKQKLADLEEEKEAWEKELEEVERNLHTLENFKKKLKDKMPEDKQKYLDELSQKKAEIQTKLQENKTEISEIHSYLASLKVTGHISASGKVYPGVRIFVKDASLEVRSEYKAVTFINEANLIKVTKFEKSEEDYSRRK
jgi:uncharacterized protein (DUF342 family)